MTTARDIMNAGVTRLGEHNTLTAAAKHLCPGPNAICSRAAITS